MERKDIITSQLLFTHSPQVNLLNVCKWNNGITENCNCFVHVLEIGSSATTMEGISPSLFLKSRIVKKVMDTIMSLVLWVFYSLNKAFVSLLINGLSLHNWLPLLVQWNFSLIINGAMRLFILHLHFFFISNSAALNQCAGSSLGYLYWINYKCEKYSFYANTQKRLVFPHSLLS